MARARYAPARGDVVWLEFNPQSGHEQAGHRPALVISPVEYNGRVGLALCCPVTSRVKGYPFEVPVPPGSTLKGSILADQVKSLDWRTRRAELLCKVPDEVVDEVVAKLQALLA